MLDSPPSLLDPKNPLSELLSKEQYFFIPYDKNNINIF
jgi:hypothetical protein